jgi:hypothetical protein
MSFLFDLLETIFGQLTHAFCFMTGEVLHWAFSLGSHRIRWWESADDNVTWPKAILGFLFWCAVGSLVWQLAF